MSEMSEAAVETKRLWLDFLTDEKLSAATRASKGNVDGALIALANTLIGLCAESLCNDVVFLKTGEASTFVRDDLFPGNVEDPGCRSAETSSVLFAGVEPISAVDEPVKKIFRRDVPRTKLDKQRYGGFPCHECKDWFADELEAATTDEEVDAIWVRVNRCCKHRQDTAQDEKGIWRSTRPKTPPDYWNLSFEVKNRLRKRSSPRSKC